MKRFVHQFKKYWLPLLLVLLLAAAGTAAGFHVFLCGRPVSRREWNFYRSFFKAQVFAEYGEQNAAANKALKELAANAVRRDDRLRKFADEKGIDPLPSFASFSKDLQKVNRERAADAAAGRPVYGTVEYSLENYYAQLRGKCENDLARQLIQQVLEDPDTLKTAYDQMTAADFVQRPKAQLTVYCPEDKTMLNILGEALEENPALSEQQARQLAGCPVTATTRMIDSKTLSREESPEQEMLFAAVECGAGGWFVLNESEVCFVQTLQGIGKPELKEDPVSVAVWQARRIFEERVGPLE